jgi:molybdenum cofactor cytidylyltransferase
MGELWSIILAAGESKRMGFPKMLLTINGRSMLENVINTVAGSNIKNTLVVLGAEKDKLMPLIEKYSVKSCYNGNYSDGMLSSVKYGFRNLPTDFDAVLIFQGDQPFISPDTINKVIEAYRSSGKGIVIPLFDKHRGHPLLLDRKYKGSIEKLVSSEGLRSLSYQFPDDVLEVETNDSGILRDIDTYEEFTREKNQIN